MATIHISEADAAEDFASLMAQVRKGMEIVIESNTQPVAVLRAANSPAPLRLRIDRACRRLFKETWLQA